MVIVATSKELVMHLMQGHECTIYTFCKQLDIRLIPSPFFKQVFFSQETSGTCGFEAVVQSS